MNDLQTSRWDVITSRSWNWMKGINATRFTALLYVLSPWQIDHQTNDFYFIQGHEACCIIYYIIQVFKSQKVKRVKQTLLHNLCVLLWIIFIAWEGAATFINNKKEKKIMTQA